MTFPTRVVVSGFSCPNSRGTGMDERLADSRAAWEKAVDGMRVVQPTYKPALILTILDRLDRGVADGEEFVKNDAALSAAFDLLLLRIGAYLGPSRIFQPLRHLAVRSGSMPDQLWRLVEDRIVFNPEFLPVAASSAGRAWLRELIASRLRSRSVWSGVEEAARLAGIVSSGASFAAQDFAQLAEHWSGLSAARVAEYEGPTGSTLPPALERLGLTIETSRGHSILLEGDVATGAMILSRAATGDFGMSLLTTSVQRRQGQRIFAHLVRANFDGWCAFCTIRLQPIVEAAHLKTVAEFPEIGLDPQNGIALCSNHHGAFDSWLLGIDGSTIMRAPHLTKENATGLLSTLLPRVRSSQLSLRDHALAWRRDEFARRRNSA